uniref:Uncharacterized protein n=1 Tax=Candidatus Nitrotoga fabula TaxID=2182327 RepID=A0A2X0RA05_9PROT|nr:protein of unknown function [Candidatus Nitrotoga fabula]
MAKIKHKNVTSKQAAGFARYAYE